MVQDKEKTCLSVVTYSELRVIMGRGSDFVEKHGSTSSQISSGSRKRYDANIKTMVIDHAEVTNNSVAGWKFDVTESSVRRWRQMKVKLRSMNLSRKSFSGTKTGWFPRSRTACCSVCAQKSLMKVSQCVKLYAPRRWNYHMKCLLPQILASSKLVSTGWCIRMIRAGLALRR
jgi:hypothetical protein